MKITFNLKKYNVIKYSENLVYVITTKDGKVYKLTSDGRKVLKSDKFTVHNLPAFEEFAKPILYATSPSEIIFNDYPQLRDFN